MTIKQFKKAKAGNKNPTIVDGVWRIVQKSPNGQVMLENAETLEIRWAHYSEL